MKGASTRKLGGAAPNIKYIYLYFDSLNNMISSAAVIAKEVETNVVDKQPEHARQMPTNIEELLAGDGVMVKQLTDECCRPSICQPNIRTIF